MTFSNLNPTEPKTFPADTPDSYFERQNLEIEREKLSIEWEKLSVERYKARWSAISVAVPLVAIAATVFLGFWGQYQKSRDDFALKTAEILLQGDNPDVTKNKATALQTLFPSQLPKDFAESFDPQKYAVDPDTLPARKELLTLMAAKPENATQILAMWRSMFPEDEWLEPFANGLGTNAPAIVKKP
jgi:hypothetical protein